MATSRASSARFDALFQQVREPVLVLDADCRIVHANPAWEALTGYTAGSVHKLPCQSRASALTGDLVGLAACFCPPPEVLQGQAASLQTLIVHAGGERLWRRLEFWPFHNPQGALILVLVLVRGQDEAPLAPNAESQRLRTELLEVRHHWLERFGIDNLVGAGPGHRRLLEQVRAASATTAPVLVQGEPGTGKRLVARTIHYAGPRCQQPLILFDCEALPPELLARELFGSAEDTGEPTLEPPDGATLLLASVLELDRDLQARLVAALDRRPAVRLIGTTAGDAEGARQGGRLRSDFYYVLTTLVIRLPPLRDRLDELPLLAQHVNENLNRNEGRQRSGFSPEALESLLAHDWPGNLRELARVIGAAHARGDSDRIERDDLPAEIRGHWGAAYTPPPMPTPVKPLDELLNQFERRLIEQALLRARQNKSRAADLLGISRPRLYRRIKELNLPDEEGPGDRPPPPEPAEGQVPTTREAD